MRKRILSFAISFLLLTLCGVSLAIAQDRPEPQDRPDRTQPPAAQEPKGESAGGNWWVFRTEDPMTAAKLVEFQLESTNTMPDSDRRSKVILYCKNGHYDRAVFEPSIRMAGPNRPGFWGQPQMEVMVRADSWHDNKGWNWMGKGLSMDKGSVERAMAAHVFRVEFLAARRKSSPAPYIAEFSPEGLDLGQVKSACDISAKH